MLQSSGHLATERPLIIMEKRKNSNFEDWLFFIIGCLIAIIFLVVEGRGGLNYLWVPFIGLMIFGAIKTLLQRW